MKKTILAVMLVAGALLAADCARRHPGLTTDSATRAYPRAPAPPVDRIRSVLPSGWTVTRETDDVVPHNYRKADVTGHELELTGPTEVHWSGRPRQKTQEAFVLWLGRGIENVTLSAKGKDRLAALVGEMQ